MTVKIATNIDQPATVIKGEYEPSTTENILDKLKLKRYYSVMIRVEVADDEQMKQVVEIANTFKFVQHLQPQRWIR